jgi:Flp pilus assembly protein TadD
VVAAVALLAAIAVTLAVILAGTSGGKTDPRLTAQHHPRTQRAKAHSRARGTSATSRAHHETAQGQTTSTGRHTTTASPQAPRLPATPVSPSRASALEARGHNVLAAGQYATAVRILERAVAATGEHLSSCLEPTTENCLTYAYALFDLGRALLLSGHHSSAVAVLERRLQIDNQRPEVAAQLALARQG